MTNEQAAITFDSVWDGKACLLPDRDQHAPEWWGERVQTKLERRRDSRARCLPRARKNHAWVVKHAAVVKVLAGETVRQVADDLSLPYYTVRNWVVQLRSVRRAQQKDNAHQSQTGRC